MSKTREHWETVYGSKPSAAVSWFQSEPAPSLVMIAKAGVGPDAAVEDVGGGASTLVDQLLDQGFGRLSVLDVSGQALAVAKTRLGERAGRIAWLVQDITAWSPPPDSIDLWHDRAVFHFLVEPAAREAYLRALRRGLKAGGHAILATFALDGPERCSGLPVQRYAPETLAVALGPQFELIDAGAETHQTPGGAAQNFTWTLFRKKVGESS